MTEAEKIARAFCDNWLADTPEPGRTWHVNRLAEKIGQCASEAAADMRQMAAERMSTMSMFTTLGGKRRETSNADRVAAILALPALPAGASEGRGGGWQRRAILALDTINRMASADPIRTFDEARQQLDRIVTEARSGLDGTPWPLPAPPPAVGG